MKKTIMIFTLLSFSLLINCTANSRWYGGLGGGYVDYKIEQLGERNYSILVEGTGALKEEQVVEAFHLRVKELCECEEYEADVHTEPYQYRYNLMTYQAFRAVGTITY